VKRFGGDFRRDKVQDFNQDWYQYSNEALNRIFKIAMFKYVLKIQLNRLSRFPLLQGS